MPIPTLVIPANYDLWLTGLKLHLDRHRGSKAELARYLEQRRSWKNKTAAVFVSKLVNAKVEPSASLFLDIAAWLQQRTDALNAPSFFNPVIYNQ